MRYGRVIKARQRFCFRLKKNIFAEKSAKSTITRRMLVPGKNMIYVIKRKKVALVSFIHIHSRINKINKKLKVFKVKKEVLNKVSRKYQITKSIKKNINFLTKKIKKNYKDCSIIISTKERSSYEVHKNIPDVQQKSLISINLQTQNESSLLLANENSAAKQLHSSVISNNTNICDSKTSIKISPQSPEKLLGKELRIVLDSSVGSNSSEKSFGSPSRSSSVSSQDVKLVPSIKIKVEPKRTPTAPKNATPIKRVRRSRELEVGQNVTQMEKVYQKKDQFLTLLNIDKRLRVLLERVDNHPAYIKALKDQYEDVDDEAEEEFVHPPEVCKDDPYGCPFCNRVFKREYHLNIHQATHFTKQEMGLNESEEEEYKSGLFF